MNKTIRLFEKTIDEISKLKDLQLEMVTDRLKNKHQAPLFVIV